MPTWGAVGFADKNTVYYIGGWDGRARADVWSYTADGQQEHVADLPSGREWAALAWTGQYAYIFGGSMLDEVVRFDPAARTAVIVSHMPFGGMAYFGASYVPDRQEIVVAGGGNDGDPHSELAVFSTKTETFVSSYALSEAISSNIVIFDGKMIDLIGGVTHQGTVGKIYRYFPGAYNAPASILSIGHNFKQGSVAVSNGHVYLLGGYSTAAISALNVETGQLVSSTTPLATPRSGAVAVAFNDIIYLMGGSDGTASPVGTVSAFRTASDGSIQPADSSPTPQSTAGTTSPTSSGAATPSAQPTPAPSRFPPADAAPSKAASLPWWVILGIIILGVVILLVVLSRRPRNGQASASLSSGDLATTGKRPATTQAESESGNKPRAPPSPGKTVYSHRRPTHVSAIVKRLSQDVCVTDPHGRHSFVATRWVDGQVREVCERCRFAGAALGVEGRVLPDPKVAVEGDAKLANERNWEGAEDLTIGVVAVAETEVAIMVEVADAAGRRVKTKPLGYLLPPGTRRHLDFAIRPVHAPDETGGVPIRFVVRETDTGRILNESNLRIETRDDV